MLICKGQQEGKTVSTSQPVLGFKEPWEIEYVMTAQKEETGRIPDIPKKKEYSVERG